MPVFTKGLHRSLALWTPFLSQQITVEMDQSVRNELLSGSFMWHGSAVGGLVTLNCSRWFF